VLGVNSRMQRETKEEAQQIRGAQRPSVTLLVTADQAEQIAHAGNMGEIVLSLRTDLDVMDVQLHGVNIDDLRRQLAPTPQPVRQVVQHVKKNCHEFSMIAGGNKKTILVDDNGVPCQ